MNYYVIRTREFETQLENILQYIKTTFSDLVARNYFDFLESQVQNLALFPSMGKSVNSPIISQKPIRAFVSKQNIVLYRVDDANKKVFLLTIATANENYLNLMD